MKILSACYLQAPSLELRHMQLRGNGARPEILQNTTGGPKARESPEPDKVAMSPLEDWLLSEPRGEAGRALRGLKRQAV